MKLPLPKFAETWLSHPTVSKMVSFGIIGVGNTVIDFGVFTLANQMLEPHVTDQTVRLPLANVMAWIVAVSCSYVMNTMITFRAESGRLLRRKDYFNFVASGILGVIATTTTLVVLSHFIPVYAAKLVSILAGFVVNFAMTHFVVFKTKPVDPNEMTG